MAVFSYREQRRGYLLMNFAGALVVGFTLVANLSRGLPIVSLAAALACSHPLPGLDKGRPPARHPQCRR
jgi:hypothetical protein